MKITVMSYNIHKGYDWRGSKFILQEIKQAIDEVGADICLLQEVVGSSLHGETSKQSLSENQFEFLADSVWHHYSYGRNAVFPNRHHGNVTLSKFPIVEYLNHDISTNKLERRGILYTKLQLPHGKHLHLFNTHLNLLEKSRLRQTEMICELIGQIVGDEPFLLAGDFNDWTGKVSKRVSGLLSCTHAVLGGKFKTATFPSFRPVFSLDRLFYRGGEMAEGQILKGPPWDKLSDHLPIVVRVHGLEV